MYQSYIFRGNLLRARNISLDSTTVIKELEHEESYKFWGNWRGWDTTFLCERKIRKKCFRRVRLIVRSELNVCNRIDPINSLALPVVTRLNIINLPLIEIKKVDTKICKIWITHRMHHIKFDVYRLYLPRKERGRGLVTC